MAKWHTGLDPAAALQEIDAEIEKMFPAAELRDALESLTEAEREAFSKIAPSAREVTHAAAAIATIRLMMAKKGGFTPPPSLEPFKILVED